MTAPMTQAEYLKSAGLCPVCRERHITGGQIEVSGNSAYQVITCSMCGSDWTDEYELKGYSELHTEGMHDWKREVANGDTVLGFEEWKQHRKEERES